MSNPASGSTTSKESVSRSSLLLIGLVIILAVTVIVVRGKLNAPVFPGEGAIRYRLMPPVFLGTWSGPSSDKHYYLVQINANGSARLARYDAENDSDPKMYATGQVNSYNWAFTDGYVVMENVDPNSDPAHVSAMPLTLNDKFMLVTRIGSAGNPIEMHLSKFPEDKFDSDLGQLKTNTATQK